MLRIKKFIQIYISPVSYNFLLIFKPKLSVSSQYISIVFVYLFKLIDYNILEIIKKNYNKASIFLYQEIIIDILLIWIKYERDIFMLIFISLLRVEQG